MKGEMYNDKGPAHKTPDHGNGGSRGMSPTYSDERYTTMEVASGIFMDRGQVDQRSGGQAPFSSKENQPEP